MKSLENKTTEININDGSEQIQKNVTYGQIIKSFILPQAKHGGYTYEDIDHRVRIKNVIEASNGNIDLEDADYSYLKRLVLDAKWSFFHPDILKFKEDVVSVK